MHPNGFNSISNWIINIFIRKLNEGNYSSKSGSVQILREVYYNQYIDNFLFILLYIKQHVKLQIEIIIKIKIFLKYYNNFNFYNKFKINLCNILSFIIFKLTIKDTTTILFKYWFIF